MTDSAAAAAARALVRDARSGSLGTLDAAGGPFVTLVAAIDDGHGAPLFLFSGLAEHTKNLKRRPDASLLIAAPEGGSMDRARVTLTGKITFLTGAEAEAAKARFAASLPEAATWLALPDFVPARLEVEGVRFVGGFARAVTLSPEDYRR